MNFIKKILLLILFPILLNLSCQKVEKEIHMTNHLKIDFQEGDLTSLHPHDLMIYLRGISIGKTLFEGLTRIGESGKAELAGALSFELSPDGLTYTFQLRENKWSDGSLVTAYQYESAWKEALAPVSFCPRPDLLYMIKNAAEVKKGSLPIQQLGVQALDEKTLKVDLARPSPHFLELLAQPIAAPLQEPSERELKHFNGPFVVESWTRNASLKLKPNPHFWNHKKVSLQGIEVSMVQETETVFSLYEQDKIDWVGVPLCPLSAEQIQYLKQKDQLISKAIDRAFWLFLNTKHPSLSSASIRKALSLAINRESITNNVFLGNHPLEKPLPLSLLPSHTSKLIKEDTVEAKKLFQKGLEELGLTKEQFPPLVITYSQQANRKQLAEYLQEVWTKVLSIDVRLEPQEWNVLRTNLGTGRFEISGAFEASFYHDPLEIMERLVTLNSSNFPQWVYPLYQQKISSAAKEVDASQRVQFLSEAEDILMDQMPFIPISSDTFLFSHHPNLKGYCFDSVGAIDFSYSSLPRRFSL